MKKSLERDRSMMLGNRPKLSLPECHYGVENRDKV